ncbi:hypothetical protein [Mammaliicoccus vitulinus]|uniref:hypothetical protein n=1 Tax=Mammaliicoccus vitulinus TaxID=71237 RepID=UPI00145A3983|nr:hypothetical protein [Mammaliicoccus vitulinus]QJF25480.1 hypothetical protein HF021_08335 [Mammaliicoccus vitulinus]
MKKIISVALCTTILLGGCGIMSNKKEIPETVSVKDYDGKYIGDHDKKNEAFLEKHKAQAEKMYKDYVKEVFGKEAKINGIHSYSNPTPSLKTSEGISIVGTVDYDVPFQFYLSFVEVDGQLALNTITQDQSNEIRGVFAAMLYKRYEQDIETARRKFKKVVEKDGYYAMNKKLEKHQEFKGVTKQYLNFTTESTIGVVDFKKDFKPVMELKGEAFNQSMDKLIQKYPEIKNEMKTDFVAYYKDKDEKSVNEYSWDLQIPTNETMKKIHGDKGMYFFKDKVSPTDIDQHGRLVSTGREISMDGGMWDEIKKEENN